MLLNLAPHQTKIVDWILDHKRCAIWASMGSGKTVSVLTALSYIHLWGEKSVLVIAPLRVAQSVWTSEVQRWSNFSHMNISVITGTVKQRTKVLKTPAVLYVINFENLGWLVQELKGTWPFATIVVDESTKLKSFRLRQGSKTARALAKPAWESERFIELTGTPSPNGLIDLWGQIWFLDKGKRLGRVFQSFVARWFNTTQVGSHIGAVKHIPKANAQKEIEEKLSDCCLSLNIADYQNIDKPILITKKVPLPQPVMKQYHKFQRELYCDLQGENIEAFNSASKTVKCLQLANGAVYYDEEKHWKEVHDEKIKALEVIIEKANAAPIIVAYHFNSDLARLQKAFPQGRKLDQNPQTIREWNEGKIPLLFAHPASCGHGLNLQYGGNILVFFSLWWDLEEHQQMIERIGVTRQRQAGFKRAVFVYYLIAQNTIDELVLRRLQTKATVQDLLLEAMKKETIHV
ncbi:DEAD/DEAH box helicase [Candidatus Liberibacter asiaticus]|uniref:DEAD/DEAH box helicase n=1 Tax=Liberibacter asiaticus TaxID=34021 RepID=UPI001572A6B2|nr:DEAD/DEAH box helicase [Candidatus Liberibacter asiaticus]